MAITWQNLATSNLPMGDPMRYFQSSQDSIGNAFAKLGGLVGDYGDKQDAARVEAFMTRLQSAASPEEVARMQASGELNAMRAAITNPANLAKLRDAEGARTDSLMQRAISKMNLTTAQNTFNDAAIERAQAPILANVNTALFNQDPLTANILSNELTPQNQFKSAQFGATEVARQLGIKLAAADEAQKAAMRPVLLDNLLASTGAVRTNAAAATSQAASQASQAASSALSASANVSQAATTAKSVDSQISDRLNDNYAKSIESLAKVRGQSMSTAEGLTTVQTALNSIADPDIKARVGTAIYQAITNDPTLADLPAAAIIKVALSKQTVTLFSFKRNAGDDIAEELKKLRKDKDVIATIESNKMQTMLAQEHVRDLRGQVQLFGLTPGSPEHTALKAKLIEDKKYGKDAASLADKSAVPFSGTAASSVPVIAPEVTPTTVRGENSSILSSTPYSRFETRLIDEQKRNDIITREKQAIEMQTKAIALISAKDINALRRFKDSWGFNIIDRAAQNKVIDAINSN